MSQQMRLKQDRKQSKNSTFFQDLKKCLEVGTGDLKKLLAHGDTYVDKTLAIKELLESGGSAFLMIRPRGFGKTLMLSMIQYFFEKTASSNAHLFKDKKIWNEAHPALGPYKNMQGKYPVIKLNFKDIEGETWDVALNKFSMVISQEFDRHRYLLDRGMMSEWDKEIFEKILNRTATQTCYQSSLLFLSKLLWEYHSQCVMFILDNYDVPIQAAYLHGYYEDMISFTKPLLSSILKSNAMLARGFVAGTLHVIRDMGHSLNHLNVFTLTRNKLADKFGFTDQEVKKILVDFNLSEHYEKIKALYNGYQMDHCPVPIKIYNPRLVVEYIKIVGSLCRVYLR